VVSFENIERFLREDIQEKKKAGRGVFSMRGKGVKHGFSGALKTPYYYMSNKEKKKLDGEVKVSNMYETVIPFREFELKDQETKKAMLIRWREIYANTKIMKEMGLNNSDYYKLIGDLEIPKKPRTGGSRPKAKNKTVAVKPKEIIELMAETPKKEAAQIQHQLQQIITNGLHVEYNGTYDHETLNKLFTKLQLLIDGEPNNFRISLSLSEVDKV
jgi:hypothetical protein